MIESADENRVPITTIPPEYDTDQYRYSAACLGDVVTLSEAAKMWEIPESTLGNARLRLKIDGRKSLSGGTILLSVRSLVIVYGGPKFDPLKSLRKGESK